MDSSAIFQYCWKVVLPHVQGFELVCREGWLCTLFVLNRLDVTSLAFIFFHNLESALRNKSCSMGNSADLGAKIVLLLSFKVRVGADFAIKITSQKYTDSASSLDLSRGQVR